MPLLNVAELPDGTQARVNVTEVVKGQSAPVARIDLQEVLIKRSRRLISRRASP